MQIIPCGVGHKPVPFPVKVVVVSNGRYTGFHDDLRDGKTKRNIHRDRQGILGNEKIEVEFFDETIEVVF